MFLPTFLCAVLLSQVAATIRNVYHNIVQDDVTGYYYTSTVDPRFVINILQKAELTAEYTNLLEVKDDFPSWMRQAPFSDSVIAAFPIDEIRVYYTATNVDTGLQAIGVTFSNLPLGNYNHLNKPLLSDPNYICSQPNLLFPPASSTNDSVRLMYTLNYHSYIATLSSDGLEIVDSGELDLKPTLGWEGKRFRKMWSTTRDEYVYIFYTAEDKTTVSVARSRFTVGPYEKLGRPLATVEESLQNTRMFHNQITWSDDAWPHYKQ